MSSQVNCIYIAQNRKSQGADNTLCPETLAADKEKTPQCLSLFSKPFKDPGLLSAIYHDVCHDRENPNPHIHKQYKAADLDIYNIECFFFYFFQVVDTAALVKYNAAEAVINKRE